MAAADWGGMNAGYPDSTTTTQSIPAASGASSGVGRALHVLGALLSVALIAGLGNWGYTLVMRDVTGIPVVRALEGPMRVQPDNPGGVAADYQGLAVNTIAAEGQAEGPTDSVTLAPAPVALAEEDRPAVSGAEVVAVPVAEADEMPAAAVESAEPDPMAVAMALAEAVSEGVAPLTGKEADLSMAETPEAPETPAADELAADIDRIPASVPGVTLSPRPAPRPAELVTRAALTPASSVAPVIESVSGAREVDPETIPTGTRLVQLGAFDSEEVARIEWDRLAGRFEDILDGKSRVIQRAQSGGKTFYRLRAMGFEDLSDARRFCAAMMAGQAPCIPVVTR
ncbi:SPOR domain-containing protein [Maritimibacter fusiformis]|uniref:SPOR domain-containing protein n=1 Tax=Maritimibacter fusiformis TaxID=2603819 RepID=A0A5D0RKP4_9RHOB|nr:SPOR domain-containing protein [Maritimibacter fusiformis]TYB81345.1 SPOR domain-containing protein [Maritimibacter fusiformis]